MLINRGEAPAAFRDKAEFIAHPADVRFEGAGIDVGIVAPNAVEQIDARKRGIQVAEKQQRQVKFLGGKDRRALRPW